MTTNTHLVKNKLMRAYTWPHKLFKKEGNHYMININGTRSTYHRRRLKEVTYKCQEEEGWKQSPREEAS